MNDNYEKIAQDFINGFKGDETMPYHFDEELEMNLVAGIATLLEHYYPTLNIEPPKNENQWVLNWILDYPGRKWSGFWLAEKYSYAKAVYEDRYSGWLPLPPKLEGE